RDALRPQCDEMRKLARFGVIAAQRPRLAQTRRAEEHDGVADARARERMQRLQILGEDAQRARVVAVEERLVLVGELGARPDRIAHWASLVVRVSRVALRRRLAFARRPQGLAARAASSLRTHGFEIDEATHGIGAQQLDRYPVADVEP